MATNHQHWGKAQVQKSNTRSDSTAVIFDFEDDLLTQIEAERYDQRRRVLRDRVLANAEDSSVSRTRRVVELSSRESCSSFVTSNISDDAKFEPIVGYAQEPLLPLAKACDPLVDIVENILFYVQIAIDNTPEQPPDGLTIDESAAIRLYTMEWEEPCRSLYSMLNRTLKHRNQKLLVPYFKYMKLFLTALVKLPSLPPLTVWRGVTGDISTRFPPGTLITCWSFLSCTTELTSLENNIYLSKSGIRTLFCIDAMNCRRIRNHSEYSSEDEVILLPGTQVIVQSPSMPASDLHVVHVKQILPEKLLLEPPFQGAMLYPKMKQAWYEQKRFMISLCLLAMFFLAAMIVGSVLVIRLVHQREKNAGSIRWNDPNWAFGCDFHSDSIQTISVVREKCGPACVDNRLCTHFTWSSLNGSMCQMKQNNVSREDAFHTTDPTAVCGVAYISDYTVTKKAVNWQTNETWAYRCAFKGNDLLNFLSTSAGCSEECSRAPLCTHFVWYKYNGGTCYMKQGNISKENAVATNDGFMVCGIPLKTNKR